MLARNFNAKVGASNPSTANNDNIEDMEEGNLDDVDENEGNISVDANMNNLKTMNRDENGLPVALSKNVGKLPPLSNVPQIPSSGLINMPNSTLMGSNKGPGKLAPMPIMTNNQKDVDKKDEPKYSEYIRLEKMRKFKRLPRLVGERGPVKFTCPSCGRDGKTQTNYELTGNQICSCISLCWLCSCTLSCCLPFFCCRAYNVKHSCPKCYY